MPDRITPSWTSTGDNLLSGADKLTERAAQLNERVSDVARAAADKIDENRESAARRLESAATAVHEHAGTLPGGERVNGLAHATVDTLRSTAEYNYVSTTWIG